MDVLAKILDVIQHNLLPAAGTIGVVVEMGLRLIPSQKPLSVMYVIEDVFHMVGKICGAIGDMMDKVLPQRLK